MAQQKVQKAAVPVEKSESEESGDSSSDSSDSDSDSDDGEGVIPKNKLAGRVRGNKRKSESFRKMFRDD
jgi:hypothetical protein